MTEPGEGPAPVDVDADADATASEAPAALPAAPLPPRARTRGRVLRGSLLVAAVAAVGALDTGIVPLPAGRPAAVRPVAGGTVPADTAAADRATTEGIRITFDAASAAMTSRDVTALTALVDPAATAAGESLRAMGANLRGMPVQASLDWQGTWTAASGATPAVAGSDEVVAQVRLVTSVEGYDPGSGIDLVRVGLRQQAGRWLITSWAWADAAQPPPWDLPGLQAIAEPHVLVLVQSKNARVNERLAARAEAATADAAALWTSPRWNGREVVVAVTERRFLDAWFGAGRGGPGQDDADWFVLRTTQRQEGASPVTGLRAVLATDFLMSDTRVTRSNLRFLVTKLSFQMSDRHYLLPGWLFEGAADYTGFRPRGAADTLEALRARGLYDSTVKDLRRGTWQAQLTIPQDTFGQFDEVAEKEWDSAFLAVAYIVDTYGEAKLKALVAAVLDGADAETAMIDTIGVGHDRLSELLPEYARRLEAKA